MFAWFRLRYLDPLGSSYIDSEHRGHKAPGRLPGAARAHGKRGAKWWEPAIDRFIPSELLVLKLPSLFFSFGLRRRGDWADAGEQQEYRAAA